MTSLEDAVATLLDVLAVLLVAAALALGLYAVMGWWALAVSGVWVFAAVRGAEAVARYRQSVREADRR